MRQTKYYKIADFVFSLDLPDGVDDAPVLPDVRDLPGRGLAVQV